MTTLNPVDTSRTTPVFSELEHRYGPHVHILDDPYSLTLLARLSDHRTQQPDINRLITTLYQILLHATISNQFPLAEVAVQTRLFADTPQAVWEGHILEASTRVVVVALARAGLLPSNLCFEALNDTLVPKGIRQDHFMINRDTDAQGRVTGASISGCKVGGDLQNAVVLVPDPMGATGSSIVAVLDHYKRQKLGTPLKVILMHLVITPEYIRAIHAHHPEAIVIALRLDRGLSSADVLETLPGERWEEEKGLNSADYIVPGIGGLGEMMNNSWV
jgi:uracil phosphoribosyltransferase